MTYRSLNLFFSINSDSYINFAGFYSEQGLFKEAAEILKKGTWELPEDAGIYYELVVAQLKAGEPKKA